MNIELHKIPDEYIYVDRRSEYKSLEIDTKKLKLNEYYAIKWDNFVFAIKRDEDNTVSAFTLTLWQRFKNRKLLKNYEVKERFIDLTVIDKDKKPKSAKCVACNENDAEVVILDPNKFPENEDDDTWDVCKPCRNWINSTLSDEGKKVVVNMLKEIKIC